MLSSLFIFISTTLTLVHSQSSPTIPVGVVNSWPQDYPGKPQGDYSPAWQSYFEVTEPLPGVDFSLGRSFAGNIGVDRTGHPNNTIFFWGFEKSNGSLTTDSSTAPWGIWLNGGPGSSSLLGLAFENGPIRINPDLSLSENPFSWDRLADYFWLDQPVGTGFSTADLEGFVGDEEQMATDFWNFVTNLVKVFPSLKNRPLHLTGESYAGTYIPYITKAYFNLQNPPTTIAKIAIGDGVLGNQRLTQELSVLNVIETYPQLISYDPEVFQYFQTQSHLCGYDVNLSYPETAPIPTINPAIPARWEDDATSLTMNSKFKFFSRVSQKAKARAMERKSFRFDRRSFPDKAEWKRDLRDRPNGTIDPWYGCALLEEMVDYAVNFSLPWSNSGSWDGFNFYNVPDALNPESPLDASEFLNNDATRAAIHAPTSKNWAATINYPFSGPGNSDPSPPPMAFLNELATNTTKHNIGVIIYSGNNDALVAHRGSEVAIQNVTFGGIQGFTRKPTTPFFDDNNNFAGIAHQERGWSFFLFRDAAHQVPLSQPAAAFTFLREFILGNSQIGLVVETPTTTSVIGGETSIFQDGVLPGDIGIFVGSGATQSTFAYPAATVDAWAKFAAKATSAP
ncbi:hypothetical protein NLI96_g2695 [Meripilus lineatus]|uniref:Carboxypeptidase n=1 Tax=Meripilus lineatus TaxID=2056292 RepID=A0AAD5VAA5_9APHY|nr:hypothetical protein NLI96_g2695 [Physisporinus lineatus]